jgi:hypothetical protein
VWLDLFAPFMPESSADMTTTIPFATAAVFNEVDVLIFLE